MTTYGFNNKTNYLYKFDLVCRRGFIITFCIMKRKNQKVQYVSMLPNHEIRFEKTF